VILGYNRAYGDAYHITQYGPVWLNGLTQMITTLRGVGAQVVVIGPLPHAPDDVPNCLSAHLDSVTDCNQQVSDAIDANGLNAERAAVETAGGHYLDVEPWFCNDTTCAVIVGNILVYRDENHLTTHYTSWLAPALDAALDDILAHAGS